MDRSGVASTSSRTQRGRAKSSQFGCSLMGHSIGELSEQEFHARFYILDFIFIQISDGEASSTNGLPNNMI